MAAAVLPLGQVQLGTGLTTIVTAPAQPLNVMVSLTCIIIANTDSAARTFTLRVGSGSLTVANSWMENVLIDANKTYIMSENQGFSGVLSAGQLFQGLADVASKITVSAYGDILSGK